MPRYSVVLCHYQGGTSHRELCRGVNSLFAQTCQDFELLAYHDGPLLDTSLPMPVPFVCMDKRYNDWGHSLFDRGIREAKGDYIVLFNSDDILYPNALEEIAKTIDRPPWLVDQLTGQAIDTNNVIIFAIIARGLVRLGDHVVRWPHRPEYNLILTGNPPRPSYIDTMQLVMRRDLWLAEGSWYEKDQNGDGLMYQKFATKYGYRSMEMILGEHF